MPDPTPLPTPRPASFGLRVRSVVETIADAWRRWRASADDDVPIIADYLYPDVANYIRAHGLQSLSFNHDGAAKSIAATVLDDPSHVAWMLTAHLPSDEQRDMIESAVKSALRYLANIGVAGSNVVSPPAIVAGKITPKPDDSGPERAA